MTKTELIANLRAITYRCDCRPGVDKCSTCDTCAAAIRAIESPWRVYVAPMKCSNGTFYYGIVEAAGQENVSMFNKVYREICQYTERYKAEYEVARWNQMLNGGPEPDILAYDAEKFPND